MTTNGRGSAGISTNLEIQHPGNVGAYPRGPSASLHARPRVADATDADERVPSARTATRGRSTKSRVSLLVRRTHLYLGLVLLPFVALYGVTALMFNHASWFHPIEERALDRETIANSALMELTRDPVATARALVPAGIEPSNARWEGGWSFESRGHGRVERFDLDARARGGRARAWEEDAKASSSLPGAVATKDVPGWGEPTALASALAPDLGLRGAELATKRAPRLAFEFEEEGRPLLARWDPANGSLRVVPREGRDPVEFLQTLHMAHGTPGFVDARWWWSWIVDAMGFAMIAWAITGAWLWWTIRAVRVAGTAVLALAAVLCIALFAGMHAAIPV